MSKNLRKACNYFLICYIVVMLSINAILISAETIDEIEPNNDFTSATSFTAGSTIHGVTDGDDDDFWKIYCNENDRIVIRGSNVDATYPVYISIYDPNQTYYRFWSHAYVTLKVEIERSGMYYFRIKAADENTEYFIDIIISDFLTRNITLIVISSIIAIAIASLIIVFRKKIAVEIRKIKNLGLKNVRKRFRDILQVKDLVQLVIQKLKVVR